jgi:hypothetical protein
LRFLYLLLLLPSIAYAAPISRDTLNRVIGIGIAFGVPASVTYQLQMEESAGDPEAVSRPVRGYCSRGLFQIYDEPEHLAYLIRHHWPHDPRSFNITDPIDNAILALSYLSSLHNRFGNWYEALVYYNSGRRLRNAPESSKAYARRIVNSRGMK